MESPGIPFAVDGNTGRRYSRSDISQDPQPFDRTRLLCAGCRVPVVAVGSYSRHVKDQVVEVAPYYRLKDRDRCPHEEKCPYDWGAQTALLVSESRRVLEAVGEGGFELKLPPYQSRGDGTGADVATGLLKRNNPLRIRTSSGPSLRIMLNTTNKIARLLTLMDDPELTKRFTAQYHGIKIPWWEFYCDLAADNFRDSMKMLEGQALRYPRGHPVAVAGIVKEVRNGSNGSRYIEFDMKGGVRNKTKDAWLHARIYSGSSDRVLDFSKYQPGDHILAYGLWKEFRPRGSSNDLITLWCDHASSVTRFSPQGG